MVTCDVHDLADSSGYLLSMSCAQHSTHILETQNMSNKKSNMFPPYIYINASKPLTHPNRLVNHQHEKCKEPCFVLLLNCLQYVNNVSVYTRPASGDTDTFWAPAFVQYVFVLNSSPFIPSHDPSLCSFPHSNIRQSTLVPPRSNFPSPKRRGGKCL